MEWKRGLQEVVVAHDDNDKKKQLWLLDVIVNKGLVDLV